MQVWNGLESIPRKESGFVATIGNYDGVHLGHQTILRRVLADARHRGVPSLLITFEPHPLSVVAPERAPRLLQTRRQKLLRLEECGVEQLLILPFDAKVAALDPDAFFETWLGRHLRFEAIHVGENFRFGHRRAGDVEALRRLGQRMGFAAHGVEAVRRDGEKVSSSTIRRCVAEGDVETAHTLLGRPFALDGSIRHGDGRGRTLQYPTANLNCENELLPANGVYVTESTVRATRLPSVTNVGVRPTFNGQDVRVESHVLDFDEEIYGEQMELHFLARLRGEQRFDSKEALVDQIARDRAAAESYFSNLPLEQS